MTAVAKAAPRPAGWWGMALFVGAEATLFASIFGTYVYLRAQVDRWPPAGLPEPEALWPVLLTAALVATSLLLAWSLRSARAGRLSRARLGLAAALAVQAGFLAAQLVLLARDLDRFPPGESAYGSIHALLLGTHAAHVAAGVLLSLWVLVRLATGLTRYRLVALQATVFYWGFVNAVSVLVLAFQLSPRL